VSHPNTGCFKTALLLLFFITNIPLFAQKSKADLETEKKQNLLKIAQAEKILSETESKKKVTIGQLNAINEQIRARQSLINALSEEIKLLDEEIGDLNIVVGALQNDLKSLKEEYATMIYSSYKANQSFGFLTFIFSSSTFNQLYMRLKYMEQYGEARRLQAQQIVEVTTALDIQLKEVEVKREEQSGLLSQQIQENRKLISLKNRQNSIIADLNNRQIQLRTEVNNRKKANERLDRLIADLINREIERNKTLSTQAIASEAELTSLFERNKNKLPWPVTSGFISSPFGRQPHPVLKGILIDNTGVDIQTNGEMDVISVFDGEVKTKAFVPGMNNVVIVKHGKYFTVYSKLKEVNVERGQKIKASDVIGKVFTDPDGKSEVHFEVWRNTEKLDPEKWLSK
jgi:septal ring factor EnvC (AmiA/AmiB activator)